MSKVYRIGFLGMGTVAQGVWKHLSTHKSLMEEKFGAKFELSKVCVKDRAKSRSVKISESKFVNDPYEIVNDPKIDIVCELIGGVKLAYDLTMQALKNGKVVVSANKAVVCEKGKNILASTKDGAYFFEASVAGGIPIIKTLREALIANSFYSIYGILNGTCNYILTRMTNEGLPFDEILAQAKKLGYVEADESLDIDGIDTAHKAVILTYLANGIWLNPSQMIIEGIRKVSQQDIQWAKINGYKIKLIAAITKDSTKKKISARVVPALVSQNNTLSSVNEVYNAVSVDGDLIGRGLYIGRGAGQDPTASAVISDLYDAMKFLKGAPQNENLSNHSNLQTASLEEIKGDFYMRICVKDKSGVLAKIATEFAKHNVSIELLEQSKHQEAGKAWIILTTHTTNELAMKNLCSCLSKHSSVCSKPFVLRVFE